jgi:hypothetical protein
MQVAKYFQRIQQRIWAANGGLDGSGPRDSLTMIYYHFTVEMRIFLQIQWEHVWLNWF